MESSHRIQLVGYDVGRIIQQAKQMAFQATAEVVKVATVVLFLEFLGKRFLNDASKIAPRRVYAIAVFAPLLEEIIFRGVLLRGIHLAQKSWNDQRGYALSEEDAKAQLRFRIYLSSILFAAAHLTNPHKSIQSAVISTLWAGVDGVNYGYLSEKYKTLSLSILAHGLHNFIAIAVRIYPSIYPFPFSLMILCGVDFIFFLLTCQATSSKLSQITASIRGCLQTQNGLCSSLFSFERKEIES